MTLLLLLGACTLFGQSDPGAKDVCETVDSGTDVCPIDRCALECGGVDCCVEVHGRGLEGSDLERLQTYCEGDACDPGQYLSAAAAVCAAQAQGLGAGLDECTAAFAWEGQFYWRAHTDIDLPCETDWDVEGQSAVYYLDPITGELVGETRVMYSWDSCP